MKNNNVAGVQVNQGTEFILPSIDITEPAYEVEIEIREDKKVLWVHVNGQTVLRICRIAKGLKTN